MNKIIKLFFIWEILLKGSSFLFASAIYVEVPKNIEIGKIRNGEINTFKIMEEVIDSTIKEFMKGRKLKDARELDFYIIFTCEEKRIHPLKSEIKLGAKLNGDLTPVRGNGWTDSEWQQVLEHFNLAEPRIMEVYGPPFRTVNVRIHKDPNLPCAGIFYPSFFGGESTIKLKAWGGDKEKGILTHEMVHAFRDDWIVEPDQFEEGMAEAVTVEVQNRIFEETGKESEYPWLFHKAYFSSEYVLQEYWNTSFLATNSNNFSVSFDPWGYIPRYRYWAAGYEWWKVMKDDPNFMKNFNQKLHDMEYWWERTTYNECRDIAFDVFAGGEIEGKTFQNWFNQNPILNINHPMASSPVPQVMYLGVIPPAPGYDKLLIYFFWRYTNWVEDYEEIPLGGEPIRIKVWNWKGEMVRNFLKYMENDGGIWVSSSELNIQEYGRYKIEVYPENYANPQNFPWLYKEIMVWHDNVAPINFFGAIGAELNNKVYFGSYGHIVNAQKGIFNEGFTPYSGEEIIFYDSRFLGYMESKIIKDKAPYFIYPGIISKVPPAQPQNLIGNIAGNQITLIWNPNYELDLKGYNVYRKIDNQDYQKINPSIIPTISYSDAIPSAQFVMYRVTALDINNYESDFSDPIVLNGPILSGFPISEDEIKVYWQYPEDPYNFILEWSLDGINWSSIVLPGDKREYIHSGLTFGNDYHYHVKAKYIYAESPYSLEIIIPLKYLAKPTNLQANSLYPYNSVSLIWQDNSNYETGYEIWRKDINRDWTKIATIQTPGQGTGWINYTDNSVSRFNDYFYKVKAISGSITSEYSNTSWVTTSPILLSNPDTFYFNGGKGKKIIYKNNKWHLVFNTEKRVYYSYSNDNGITWNTDTIVKINLPNRWVEDAALAIDDQNRIWVFYEYNGPANFKIKYKVKIGNNWSEEDSIPRYGKNPCAFSLNGSVYLVFECPVDKEGIKVYMCEFPSSNQYIIDSLRERCIGKGSISGSYFSDANDIILSAQYGSASFNMYDSLMYYKWDMNAFKSVKIDNEIIKEYNHQHFVDKNILCFLEKKYDNDIDSLRVIKYDFYNNKWEWFISKNFQRIRFPEKVKNPRISYDGTNLFIIYERDSLNYYYIEGFRITNNGGLIRYRFSILPSNIKTYPDIYIYKGINKIYLGIIYNSSQGIIFKRKEIPITPPPTPEPIEDNLTLLDIPPNNSKRISLFDNSLHILYSKNNSIFDAILKDNEIIKKFLGYGKNPALFLYKGNLYTIWAYNDTTGLEEIKFSKYDTSWTETKSSYTTLNTYYWGIGAPSFYIENDTGYVVFESEYGYTAHILPVPPIINLWNGKNLILYKFPLIDPLNYQILYKDSIPEMIYPVPIETVKVPLPVFYEEIVPKLISPSGVFDKGISNIIWDGINKFLKIYKIGNDTIIKTIYPEYENVKDPYAYKENSIIRFIWVDYDSLNSGVYTCYTLKDKEISEIKKIYEGYKIKEPFLNRNYIVFVENDGFYDNLVFGELKFPFEKEILFSSISIRSPQILYDENKNKFYITFYSGDTIYNLYKIEKEISEIPPDLTFDFGNIYKEPITIYREGYISLGIEDYKNLDFGDSLLYEIPLYHASKVKIRFEAYLNKDVKEKIYINNHPIGTWHIKENQHEIYEKQVVPPVLDSILKIKIEKKQGDKVYLGKLSIYIEERKGGIQGDKIENILRFSLNISPNIIKDKGIFEIVIPEKQRINLSIYDISGRKIITLLDDFLNPGIYKINIDSKKFKKGIYFAVLKGKEEKAKKFVILK